MANLWVELGSVQLSLVTIPRKPGALEVEPLKAAFGVAGAPQFVGGLKAARGYPARLGAYCSFEYVSSPILGKSAAWHFADSIL